MKKLWVFIKKEAIHIIRDKRTLMVLLIMPLAQILIFGYVITTEINQARIGIFNKANDYAGYQLVNRLAASGYFKIGKMIDNPEEMEASLRKGEVRMVVVIPSEFGKRQAESSGVEVQLVADASEANSAQMLVNYARSIITRFDAENGLSGRASEIPVTIETRMFYNPALKGVFMSVPGIMAMILILISAMMTSISITREKEYGSMEILLVSPLKPWQIIVGKVAPYIILSFINAVTILLVGIFIFKVPMEGSWWWLTIINILYILLSLSLGIFISTVSASQMVAMFISLFALLLPTVLLSGFIYPIENMPVLLRWLSSIMPPRYYIQAVKSIMFKAGSFMSIWKELLIIAAFSVAFMALSIKNFKVRLS
jgi:ABC-2 type transport system permease protein